jgi:hypothetical protein
MTHSENKASRAEAALKNPLLQPPPPPLSPLPPDTVSAAVSEVTLEPLLSLTMQ